MAEVPIIGEVDGKIISAKVDRLIVTADKVLVVDYKTNRPAAKKISDIPFIIFKSACKLIKNCYKKSIRIKR